MSDLIKTFEFIHQSSGIYETILLFWVLWSYIVFWTLRHPGPGRERFLKIIKNASPGQYYRNRLNSFLDYSTQSWFKDSEIIEDRRSRQKQLGRANFVFGVNTLTEPSFGFFVKLALLYPILSVFALWVLSGASGSPGGLSILPELSFEIRLLYLSILLIIPIMINNAANSRGVKVVFWLFGTMIAIAVGFSVAGIVTSAYFIAVVLSFGRILPLAFIIAAVVAVVSAVVSAVVFSVACAFAVFYVLYPDMIILVANYFNLIFGFYPLKVDEESGEVKDEFIIQLRQRAKWLWLVYLVMVVAMDVYFIYGYAEPYKTNSLVILFFYSILPFLNAPLDWFSTGITRSLLYAIVDRVHSGVQAFLYAVLDLLIALFFLVGITLLISLAIAFFNQLAISGGGKAIVDLTQVFTNLSNEPSSIENWWIYFILLSTLVPTLLHMVIAGFSLILWIPEHWLTWVAQGWKKKQLRKDAPKFLLAWGYFTVVSPLALIAPFALLGGSIWLLLLPGSGDQIGNWLLNTAYNIASSIDSSVAEIPGLMESKIN